ncbi:hypothetical protein GCM10011576_46980 [Micromonospora parathelypteridis]|nr:hypothetical protein GCM10011576_46980 [Micromonospora parathelypteridis]
MDRALRRWLRLAVLAVPAELAVFAVLAVPAALAVIRSGPPHNWGSSTGNRTHPGSARERRGRSRCAAHGAAGSRGQWQLPVPLSL